MRIIAAALALSAAWMAGAQDAPKPAYLDSSLPASQRGGRSGASETLEEKATQLVNQRGPFRGSTFRLYDWWSEALHGVAVNGTTEFPEPIAWRPPSIRSDHEMAAVISTEDAIKHAQAVRAGHSNIFEGWTSGRQTSTSFAIPVGDVARKPMAKTRS